MHLFSNIPTLWVLFMLLLNQYYYSFCFTSDHFHIFFNAFTRNTSQLIISLNTIQKNKKIETESEQSTNFIKNVLIILTVTINLLITILGKVYQNMFS